MPKFRKKPIVIEAFQMTKEYLKNKWPNVPLPGWLVRAWGTNRDEKNGGLWFDITANNGKGLFFCGTLEGEHRVDWDDWIIQGIQYEIYPVKDEIFRLTYEKVED